MYIGIEKKIFWEVIIFLLYGHVCPNPEPECLLQGATSFTILIEDYTGIMTIFSIFPLKCVGVEKKMVRVVQPWLLQFRFLSIRMLHTNNDNNWPCCTQEEVKNVRLLTNDDGQKVTWVYLHLKFLTCNIFQTTSS